MEIIVGILIFIVVILAIGLYFVPYIIGRNKVNSTGIFWLNLLLGFTVVGWFGALIWAFISPETAAWNYTCPHCGYKNGLDQRVTLLTCKQCLKETKVAIKKDATPEVN